MAECKYLSQCIFFNDKMSNMPATASLYKQEFCKSNFKKCARYIIATALGNDNVPNDMFPNQHERAKLLVY